MTAALVSVVDIFGDASTGRGSLPLSEITQRYGAQKFGWTPRGPEHPDLALLGKLDKLTSYDVYSLRLLFRELEIEPANPDLLKLSDTAKNSLSAHMKRFIAPLILNVYGDISKLGSASDPIDLIRNPDREVAANNLKQLADKLKIELYEIPVFLERFSDCYLSISYFERYLHSIYRQVIDMVQEIKLLRQNRIFIEQPAVRANCDRVSRDFIRLTSSVTSKIERFHTETGSMWHSLTAKRFYEISGLVDDYQVSVAGVLCGLGIKVTEWRSRFATADIGGPDMRADALTSSLLPGLDKLKTIDGTQHAGV